MKMEIAIATKAVASRMSSREHDDIKPDGIIPYKVSIGSDARASLQSALPQYSGQLHQYQLEDDLPKSRKSSAYLLGIV